MIPLKSGAAGCGVRSVAAVLYPAAPTARRGI